MSTRTEIRAGLDDGPAWLLDLDIGGRIYRVADRAALVTDEAGRSYQYDGGLLPLSVALSDEPVAKLAVSIDIGVDWALQVARGIPLVRRSAVLRRWWPGQALEAADVALSGLTQEPEYGDEYEPLTLTIARDSAEQSGLVLDALALVDDVTWPDDHLQSGYHRAEPAEGQYYPLVIGYPGHNPERGTPLPAVPALAVSITEPASTTQVYVIGDRALHATSVRFTNQTMGRSETRTVRTETDGLGRPVPTIRLDDPTPSALPGAAEGDEFWVGFQNDSTYGGGIYGLDGEVLRGAGDVIEWMLRERTTLRVDLGRLAAAKAWLNRYKVDTYINGQVSAWEWLTTVLFPLLPVVVREGHEGLYVAVVRWDATVMDAVRRLSADRGEVERAGRIRGLREPVRNQIEVRYRGALGGASWWGRRIVSAEAKVLTSKYETQDDRIRGSYACRVSQAEHDVCPWTVDCAWTWDSATADCIAEDLAARYALPKRTVRYTGGWDLEAIEPWSVIAITDSDVHLDEAPALVQQQTITSEGVTLDLILLDHPAHAPRSTS